MPLSRNRKAIVSLMTASAAIPQFGIDAEADLTELMALRDDGADFSVGDAVLRASALCLRAHPELNASFGAETVVRHANVNLGLGIIGPEGLMVVVIRDADRLSITEIAHQVGYANQSNFSVVFHRLTGRTPRSYRSEA